MATTRAGENQKAHKIDLPHQIILLMALDLFNRRLRHRHVHLKRVKEDVVVVVGGGAMNEAVVAEEDRMIGGEVNVEEVEIMGDEKVDVYKLERLVWCERLLEMLNIMSH